MRMSYGCPVTPMLLMLPDELSMNVVIRTPLSRRELVASSLPRAIGMLF